MIIGYAWFGSYKICVALLKHGCYMVASVKPNHRHFLKAKLKGIVKKTGDTHHMKVIVPRMENGKATEVHASRH